MQVMRSPQAVALLCTGLVVVGAVLIFAPDDVREWILAPGGLLAVIAALRVTLPLVDDDGRPTAAPPAPDEDRTPTEAP